MNRRRLLRVLGAGGAAGAIAGCLDDDEPDVSLEVGGEWPTDGYDAANTGVTSVTGPTDPSEQYRFETDDRIAAAPVVADGAVYVSSTDHHLYRVSAADGRQDWQFPTSEQLVASPAVVGDVVVFVSLDRVVTGISGDVGGVQIDAEPRVYGVNADDGSEIGTPFAVDASLSASPTVVEESVYVANEGGVVYSVGVTDLEEEWSVPLRPAAIDREDDDIAVRTTPAVVDDTVYVADEAGFVFALDAADGTQQWSFETDGWTSASPTVGAERVYAGTSEGEVHAVGRDDGEPRWSFTTDDRIASSPIVVDGVVFVGDNDGVLYAFADE